MRFLAPASIVPLLAGGLLSAAALTQEPVFPHPHPPRPPLPIQRPPFQSVSLESMKASVTIAEGLATTDLEQVFRNHGPAPVEEEYLFPLPDDAVATDLALWMDGREVKGELLDRARAREIYEGIVRRSRDPALLEWVGRGCVRVAAFPVPAGGEAKVRLRYTNLVPATASGLEYRLPLLLGPLARGGLRSLLVDVRVESGRPLAAIYSPTHPVDVRREGDRRARATFEGTNVAVDRDLRLLVVPAEKEFGFAFLGHRRAGEAGFFLAMFAPRFDLDATKALPKDLVVVMDTSGSMAGEKIEQAKGALRHALGRLRPGDRFNLIRFASEAEAFREAPVEASEENLEAARTWISRIEARGGTNIHDALVRALEAPRSEGRVPLLFFVTDGLPTVGTTDEKAILGAARAGNAASARIFVFGVGNDVNTRLLDTLAEETRGAREYVRGGEDIEVKVSALVDKVSSPVLSDVAVACEGAEAHDVYPRVMPDLFRGSQLVLVGRYRGEGRKTVRLSGRFGGERREWTYAIDLPAMDERNDSVRQLWASRKVHYLLDDIRMAGESRELVDEVKRLGREYGIVTPYTSFLVVEEAQRLATARGLAPGGGGSVRRLADLDGDGRLDAPEEGTGWALPGLRAEVELESLERLARDESSDASEAEKKFRELGSVATGADAVSGSLDVIGGKMAAPAPSPAARPSLLMTRPAGGGGPIQQAVDPFLRQTQGRNFHLVGSVWLDQKFSEKDRDRVIRVAFLSDEYFALLAREPGLAPLFALGSRVLLEWKGSFYEVM